MLGRQTLTCRIRSWGKRRSDSNQKEADMSRFQVLRDLPRAAILRLLISFLCLLLIPTTQLYAGDKSKISYRAYTGFMPLVAGDVNTGSTTTGTGTFALGGGLTFTGTATATIPTQSYSDAFTGGIPFILEYAYRYNSQWNAQAGIGFQYFPAKEFDAVNLSAAGTLTTPSGSFVVAGAATVKGELDDVYRIPIYLGGTYHFLDGGSSNFSPYVRVDGGIIIQPAVDITLTAAGTSTTEKFWDTSVLGLFDAGLGVEGQMGSVGAFGEVRVQYTTAPSNADALGNAADADGLLSIPIIIGMTF